jgi:Ca-activated chloride channel family protein
MKAQKDFYRILGVDPEATEDGIREAFRAIAREFRVEGYHDPQAEQRFKEIQEAFEILSDPEQRYGYDRFREASGAHTSSSISLRTLVSHEYLLTNVKEQAFYVLLDVAPAGDIPSARLPLNLCLVLDRSNSMRGARMQQVKEGVRELIDQLNDDDALSLVVFSDRAEVVLASEKNRDKALAKSLVSTIQPGGGTEMFQGLNAGLKELAKNRTAESLNHLILLTDGQTYGDEQECLEKAEWAGQNQISLTTMGIGTDWNEGLLDHLATLSGGMSVYIDSPAKVVDHFKSIGKDLGSVVARELTMKIDPLDGVSLSEVYQITPHIQPIDTHHNRMLLGPLGKSHKKTLLMEYRIHSEAIPGKKCLMRLTMEGDVPGQASRRNWEWLELFGEFVPALNQVQPIPRPIVTNLGKLTIYKMKEKALVDLANGRVTAATKRFELMATQLLNLGEEDLARTALMEAELMARTGDLSALGRKKLHYGTRALSMLPAQLMPA